MLTKHNLLENKLLKEILHGEGPLRLQRRLQKCRLEQPGWDWQHCIAEALKDVTLNREDRHLGKALVEGGIHVVSLMDPAYPLMLKSLEDPPPLLFYRGSLHCLHRPGIALVGARQATGNGLQLTRHLAGELARMGFVIVSGLARGIDGAAHQASLEVGGHTVAVLGSGLDKIYPADHRTLAEAIVDEGSLLLSEWPPDWAPKPHHFPIRNRLISGLSQAVIVVEAASRSGSLITARHALDQGRHLFAVPGPITAKNAQGPNGLIARGEAQLLESVETVLRNLSPLLTLASAHEAQKTWAIKDPLSRKIYDTLDAFEPTQLDLLTTKLGVAAPIVTAKLVALESQNLVSRHPGPVFFRNPLQSPAQES